MGDPIPAAISAVGLVAATAPSESAKIDINTADAKQLIDLPRIGEIIAQRIIDYRDANGPFSIVEDLLAVQGIGPSLLAGIRDLVEVR
ncbi:MAG: ComEA family DNA-binding protein [Chloroflexi bacterium]|nr:ComEA family DNA-binding protein [Chloroflexota bacterium]